MKAFYLLIAVVTLSLASNKALAQAAEDKSKRPSPPAVATQTLASGATVTINYSQPSVKGRTIGKDLEPMTGKIWRTGANEATTFETSKNIKVNGQILPAGKYALFTISSEKEWTVIFNKKSAQWGAYEYDAAQDALKVQAKLKVADLFAEKLSFNISKDGETTILWGNNKVIFTLQ
jgi:hypothetical protein